MAAFTVQKSQRLQQLPPYLFVEVDRMKREALDRGVDLINLGIGDPDRPTPPEIIEALRVAAAKPEHHQYPLGIGMLSYREAVARWYSERFGVELDATSEVLSLIGSKEGIGHLPLAFVNPGDVVLAPDPGYPVYPAATMFAGGEPVSMPLLAENDFLPDLDAITPEHAKRAKVMYLNYPNNPTSACATEAFFKSVIEFALQHNIIICHDAAYSEIYYDNQPPISFLQIDGAKEVGIEFNSLSKTLNMTGWRIGFAVGHREVIAGLSAVKNNLDSGQFQAIQEAGIAALDATKRLGPDLRKVYQGRRDVLVPGLQKLGLDVINPMATFYVWIKTPGGLSSTEMTAKLVEEAGIVTTPGVGLGQSGEGYVRMTLTLEEPRLAEAVERVGKMNL